MSVATIEYNEAYYVIFQSHGLKAYAPPFIKREIGYSQIAIEV